jgi:probable HAF family extracellular repeat protein
MNSTHSTIRCLTLTAATLLLATDARSQGALQELGTLAGNGSSARGVSADGTVVVGVSLNQTNLQRAFRWDSVGGIVDLGTLGTQPFGGWLSSAHGVSADGSVVVGVANNGAGQDRAVRWTSGGGLKISARYLVEPTPRRTP